MFECISEFVTITRMDGNHYVSPGKANTFYLCHTFAHFWYFLPPLSLWHFKPLPSYPLWCFIFQMMIATSCRGRQKESLCVIRWLAVQTGVLIINFTGNHHSRSSSLAGVNCLISYPKNHISPFPDSQNF